MKSLLGLYSSAVWLAVRLVLEMPGSIPLFGTPEFAFADTIFVIVGVTSLLSLTVDTFKSVFK